MPRLIDADALLEDIGEEPMNWTNSPEEIQEYMDWKRTVAIINRAPTIKALEKWNEPKRPKWFTDIHNPAGAYKCGVCEERIVEKDVDFYCPKCGQAVKWE